MSTTTASRARLVRRLRMQAGRMAQTLATLVAESRQAGGPGGYSGHLGVSIRRLKSLPMGRSPDFVVRRLHWGGAGGTACLIAYLRGAVNTQLVEMTIANLRSDPTPPPGTSPPAPTPVSTATTWAEIERAVASGQVVLLRGGDRTAYALDLAQFPSRAVSTSQAELSVKGPQDAFTGRIESDIALVRRFVRSDRLRAEKLTVGEITRTTVYVCYVHGVANPSLVETVRARIAAIRIGSVPRANVIEAFVRDQPRSPFPLTRTTDRVDLAVQAVCEGKVVVIVDNDPFVLLLPSSIMDFYRTSQDYEFTFWEATYIRLVRLAGLLVGLYLPSGYIALTSVNPDLLPVRFLIVLAGSRQALPFPPFLEVIVMFLIIEIVREASTRLAQPISSTLGTVGGIVLGTAIVKAGVVSPQMIIVVTFTVLAQFTTPAFAMTGPWRMLMWLFVLAASVLGVFGVMIATFVLVAYMARLSSVGVPFLAPFGPPLPTDLRQDSIVRAPMWDRHERTVANQPVNLRRQAPYRQPVPGGAFARLRLPALRPRRS